MMKAPRRVLVTGAAGRLGSVVAERAHQLGHDVLGTDVRATESVGWRFEHADLLDHERVLELLTDIDDVLHMGNIPWLGGGAPQQVFNHNMSVNQNVFQGAAECGVRTIVFASTLQLIGSHVDDRTRCQTVGVNVCDGIVPNLGIEMQLILGQRGKLWQTACGHQLDVVALFPQKFRCNVG